MLRFPVSRTLWMDAEARLGPNLDPHASEPTADRFPTAHTIDANGSVEATRALALTALSDLISA